MARELLSVGLDVGTTSTQLVVSRLTVENRASAFAVPSLQITGREILYRSPVYFTPLKGDSLVDSQALKSLLAEEYRRAGITPQQVDTGAVIITGETSRKENARAVLESLSEAAGQFVVTTAGPDLESVLAAKGAGVPAWSETLPEPVLHMDIGGGTSNLSLYHRGELQATGCLNVGGRLIKLDASGTLTYISPVLRDLFPCSLGERPSLSQLETLAETLARVLEMAAGLRPPEPVLQQLSTAGGSCWSPPGMEVIPSFSGGVADCIACRMEPLAFGDLGPLLGQAISRSRLCRGTCRISPEAIRATVTGAGCHSTQLSGSTVFLQNPELPLRDLPAVVIPAGTAREEIPALIRRLTALQESQCAICLEGKFSGYRELKDLADTLAEAITPPVCLCLQADSAKALGQALALRWGDQATIVCLDGITPGEDAYLDVGNPLGPALPVVVKTIIMER